VQCVLSYCALLHGLVSAFKFCPIKIENAINFVEAVASKQDSGWLLEITPVCLEYTGFLTVYFEQFFFPVDECFFLIPAAVPRC
jgi:hypothetical protein